MAIHLTQYFIMYFALCTGYEHMYYMFINLFSHLQTYRSESETYFTYSCGIAPSAVYWGIYSLRCVWIFQASFQDPFLGHIHPVTTGIVNATLYSALRLRSPDMDTLVTLLATKHPWQLNKLIRWHQIYSTFLLILVMKTVRWYSYWSKICYRLVVNKEKRQCFNFQLACESSV